jgi:two-component system copper resistance phosphate regulon response regulator CusR
LSDPKKIIVVEDEPEFAKMVKLRLESAGYEVTVAGDTYFGTQCIIKGHFQLIILDLMMPAGGGFTLLERIRNIPSSSTIPVIILTGRMIDDDIVQKAKSLDVSAIFHKPYDHVVFLAKVKELIRS